MNTPVFNTRNSDGIALPMAVFLITMLTITVTASFMVVSSESRFVDNSRDEVRAFGIAQSGLELFLVSRDSLGFTSSPPAVKESIQVTLPGGLAQVVLQRVRPSVGGSPGIYLVRSRGVSTDPELPDVPQAERTVAQFARWSTATLDVGAAVTALTGFHKNGGSGTMDGVDQCGVETDVAVMAVPTTPGYTQSGGSSVPTGSPPIEDMGTVSDFSDSISIDWAGIVAGTALTPDIVIPGGSWPSFSDPNYWPLILVTGNFALPGSGRGTLMVTGDLTMNDSNTWEGIILAGGMTTGNGDICIAGALVTGLNVKLGANPDSIAAAMGTNAIGNGTKLIYYNSCHIANALKAFEGLAIFSNAWADNWAM